MHRQCKSWRPAHACTRKSSTLKRVAILIFISVVLCTQQEVLGNDDRDNFPSKLESKSKLRRCVSLPTRMNQDAKELNSIGCSRRLPVYNPVHSPPNELALDKRQSRKCKPRNSNTETNYINLAAQESHASPTEIYTMIQTQLYPQMRF